MDIDKIVSNCMKRWGEDPNTENLKEKILTWLNPIIENEELVLSYIKLLSYFDYYTNENINKVLKNLYDKLKFESNNNTSGILYHYIEENNGRLNSSLQLLLTFKNQNKISKNNIITNFSKVEEKWDSIKYITIIEDIIGTGKTVIDKFLNKNLERFKEKTIFILCIAIMKEAKIKIETFSTLNNINVKILSYKEYNKAFEENYIFCLDNTEKRKIVKENEILIWGRQNKYILGLNETEALISFFHNTPNNTLSSFWYEKDEWQPLFKREQDDIADWEKKPPIEMMKKNKNGKENIKYNLGKILKENTN